MNECLIYDYETLAQDAFKGVVINIAALDFTESRYLTNPYTWEELLDTVSILKFDVEEQVEHYNRRIERSTIEWWKRQSKEAQKWLKPSPGDVSIDQLKAFLIDKYDMPKKKKIFTRGNNFDPVLTDSIFRDINYKDNTPWWTIRDTRSYLEAMLYGSDIRDTFVPDELESVFIKHDPAHDVAMDVYRMQYVIRVIHGWNIFLHF